MTSNTGRARQGLFVALAVVLAMFSVGSADAQMLAGAALTDALRGGGYVLVMRHANSPAAIPDRTTLDPANIKRERQLDEAGKAAARAMGEAIKALRIPVGDVMSSPTFRARQTIQLAGLSAPQVFSELEEGGAAMDAGADAPRSKFLRGKAAEAPRAGTNTLLVTHSPNITGAFGRGVADIAQGETLVFKPDGKGAANLVARVKIQDWPILAR